MVFREKAKNFFKRRTSQSDSVASKESSRDRWPSNIYKPGEPLPRPKYRRPPEKAHKDRLDKFSFAEAWRRKSFQSQHSPMGTRQPSRRNSFFSSYRKSMGSRNASIASSGSRKGKSGVKHKEPHGAARAPNLTTETEVEGDADVANVGLSRVQSRDRDSPSRPLTGDGKSKGQSAAPVHTLNTAHDHQPFSEDDLALALKRSHLAVPTR